MELVEQQQLPGVGELPGFDGQVERQSGKREPALGAHQGVLGLAVQPLDTGVGGIAARRMVLQIVLHDGKRIGLACDGCGERLDAAEDGVRLGRILMQRADTGDILLRRPSAVVADAVADDGFGPGQARAPPQALSRIVFAMPPPPVP